MNQKEIGTASFDQLLTGFLRFLKKEKSYKQSTLNNYHSRLHKIQLYMQKQEIDSYTPDVGIKYYVSYHKNSSLGIRFQTPLLTVINRLNTFSSGSSCHNSFR